MNWTHQLSSVSVCKIEPAVQFHTEMQQTPQVEWETPARLAKARQDKQPHILADVVSGQQGVQRGDEAAQALLQLDLRWLRRCHCIGKLEVVVERSGHGGQRGIEEGEKLRRWGQPGESKEKKDTLS